MGNVFHAFFAQSRTPGRHSRNTAFFDGLVDFIGITAPQPIAIGQIRKTFRAFSIRAVALDTISVKQVLGDLLGLRVFATFSIGISANLAYSLPYCSSAF